MGETVRGALGRGLKERGWGAGGGGRCRQARPVGRRSHLDQRGELPRFPSEARDPARHQRLRVRAPLQRYGAPRCDVRPRSAASSAPRGSPPCPAAARPALQFQRMRGGDGELVRPWFKARPVGQAALFHTASDLGPELLASGRLEGAHTSARGSRPDLLVRRPCSTPVIWGQSVWQAGVWRARSRPPVVQGQTCWSGGLVPHGQ